MTTKTQTTNLQDKLQRLGVSSITKICMGLLAAVPVVASIPAQALEVDILPKNAKLGDTISVLIELESQDQLGIPTVTVGEKTYPSFEIAPNKYRSFIPTTPLEKPGVRNVTVSGEGQRQRNMAVYVGDRQFRIQRINLPPGKAGVRATEYELTRVREFRSLQTPEKFWNGAFLTPNKGRMTTTYGVRRYYNGVFANDYYHRGLDYAGGAGSAVIAPAGGRVALVGTVSQGFKVHGNTVGIDHGQGVISIFLHLNRINVKEGDTVKPGQVIGTVGSTGASTGPHLHWGLYVNGQSIDPMPWKKQRMD
ncbi:MAG: M23 family metallopeptidase [Nostocales cyanobacterium]|nr:MAG: M23 family metallopeptidase [Nostocales cyanobacterium]TAF09375.1 MAG: M23 family metallopeptidase [Nostocales cyanobacterium]